MKTILVDAVEAFVIVGEGIFSAMHELLEEFPNRKILLTGANDEQMEKFGLHAMPYPVFTLKHDPEKTSTEYYRKMLEEYDLNINDVVYFEHDFDAVKSAQSVGILTYHYDSENKDIEALRDFLTKSLQ